MPLATYIIFGSWGVFIAVWIVGALGAKRDIGRSWWQRWWLSRIVLIAAIWGVIEVCMDVTRRPFDWTHSLHTGMAFINTGAVLTALGIAYAVWARVYLGTNWSGTPALKEKHELVTSGPYALVRHPIYTGMLVAIFGSSLASPLWFVVFIAAGVVFVRRIGIEEKLMMKTFPNEYPAYKKRTWALVPWVW